MSHLVEEEPVRPKPPVDVLEDLKANVREWAKLDEQIKKLQIAVRERRVHLRALGDTIQRVMHEYGYDDLTTDQTHLKAKTRVVKVPLKLVDIKQKILELQGTSGEDLIERIFEGERPTVERTSLRRIVPKVSMHLDL